MKKNTIKAINHFAERADCTPREAFDEVVNYMLAYTMANPEGYAHLYLKPAFDPTFIGDVDPRGQLEAFIAAMLAVTASMNEAEPFEDVLTDYYGSLLGAVRGQFMTPAELARSVALLLGDDNLNGKIAEPTCGTGSLILGHLGRVFREEGRAGIGRMELILNDIDKRLLCIAVLQVLFHTIKNEAPVATLTAWCADLIKEYNTARPVLRTTSQRHAVKSLFSSQ